MQKIKNVGEIMLIPVPKDEDGLWDPMIRLEAVNNMIKDVSALYNYKVLIFSKKDMSVEIDFDADYEAPIKTGGSIIRQPEKNSDPEKPNEAMQAMSEDRYWKGQLYCIFHRCFNILLDEDQRKVYAGKMMPELLRINGLSPRELSKKFDNEKRKFLLATAKEQMIEGLMLDCSGPYGETIIAEKTYRSALKRIALANPKKKYDKDYWYGMNYQRMFESYPELAEILSPVMIHDLQKDIEDQVAEDKIKKNIFVTV